jgi:hypothetical protein
MVAETPVRGLSPLPEPDIRRQDHAGGVSDVGGQDGDGPTTG